MDQTSDRLVTCFQTVFPGLTEPEARAATQSSVAAWDSVASITLLNVIEEEFGIELDLDRLAELDSFGRLYDYLKSKEPQAA